MVLRFCGSGVPAPPSWSWTGPLSCPWLAGNSVCTSCSQRSRWDPVCFVHLQGAGPGPCPAQQALCCQKPPSGTEDGAEHAGLSLHHRVAEPRQLRLLPLPILVLRPPLLPVKKQPQDETNTEHNGAESQEEGTPSPDPGTPLS